MIAKLRTLAPLLMAGAAATAIAAAAMAVAQSYPGTPTNYVTQGPD
ncbi:hypothetical protein [Mycobacterium sp. 1164985.4]|nr:hypothetical protein [Mycobacterium sp. 1164985.4]